MSDTPPPDDPTPNDPPKDPAPPGAGQPDQAVLDALAGKIRAEEKRKAEQAIREMFGGKDPKDVVSLLEKLDEAEKAQLTEAERAKVEAEEAKAAAAADRAKAARELTEARLRTALLTPGGDDAPAVNPAYLDQAVRLGLDQAMQDGDDSVQEAVAELRKSLPVFFVAGDGKPPTVTTPPAAGGPGPGEGKGGGRKSFDALANDLAASILKRQGRKLPEDPK